MAIRDYWIYQKRNVPKPWALYVVKEFEKRYHPETVTLDWTFYHDDLPTATKSKSVVGVHHDTVSCYVDEIATFIMEHVEFDNLDYEQIRQSIEDILIH